ncbi:MAG TPA: aminotransferase class V-fold PLP-dependent enzyme, partial [Chloroflexota bacterium]
MTMLQYQPSLYSDPRGDLGYPCLLEPNEEPSRLRLVGDDLEVPLVTGESRRHVNLDYAASTPPLVEVWEAVQRLLPFYSSVHRGAGYKSQVSTAAYEQARVTIAAFFGARPDDTLIFTRHTTDALNLLAACLPEGARVLTTAVEHHANLLPWRRAGVEYLPVPASPADLLRSLEESLAQAGGAMSLVAVTGASNVTGEIWPLADLTRIAHRHGARVLVDAAQLAPHSSIDITSLGVDYLALSGHKLYAPFGIGVLIGRGDWLARAEPVIQGGGAVESVTLDEVTWRGLPERHEAGTPNLVGAVALAAACRTLQSFGMARLAAEEADLYAYAWARLSAIPCLELYTV